MKGRNSSWTVGTSNVREAAAAMGVVGEKRQGPKVKSFIGKEQGQGVAGSPSPWSGSVPNVPTTGVRGAGGGGKIQGGTKKQVPTKASAHIKGGGQVGGKLQKGTKPLIPGKAHSIRGGGQVGAKLQGGTKKQMPVRLKGKAVPMTISNSLRNSSMGGIKSANVRRSPAAGNHEGPRA